MNRDAKLYGFSRFRALAARLKPIRNFWPEYRVGEANNW